VGTTTRVRLDHQGRVFIPDGVRDRLGIKEGDEIALVEDDDGVHLRTHEQAIRAIQQLVRQYVPEDVSLSDELIAERRAEAAREAAE
jgi:AbrB family looped-hinge helix DNA binding protein